MTNSQKIASFLLVALMSFNLAGVAQAALPVTLALTAISGDAVQVRISGDSGSTIRFSFLPPGAIAVTNIVLGLTDASGNFLNTLSSGGYAIPAGSAVYATINGQQSPTMLWPTYTSSLTLSQNNLTLGLGQSVLISSSNSLILAANSSPTVAGAAISGSQITISGLSIGFSNITVCGANTGCQSIAVNVGSAGATQTQTSFSQNNLTISPGQSLEVTINGNSNAGYRILTSSNPASVEASISGTSNILSLYGLRTPGTAAIKVCSVDSSTNCATLKVTTLSATANQLSFSPNNLTIAPGMSQSVAVSGGPDNN